MALQISIIQFLTFYEHLSEILAEGLTQLRIEYDYPQLGDDVIREIAGKTFNGTDNKGPRSFAKFLVKYAESCWTSWIPTYVPNLFLPLINLIPS